MIRVLLALGRSKYTAGPGCGGTVPAWSAFFQSGPHYKTRCCRFPEKLPPSGAPQVGLGQNQMLTLLILEAYGGPFQ